MQKARNPVGPVVFFVECLPDVDSSRPSYLRGGVCHESGIKLHPVDKKMVPSFKRDLTVSVSDFLKVSYKIGKRAGDPHRLNIVDKRKAVDTFQVHYKN